MAFTFVNSQEQSGAPADTATTIATQAQNITTGNLMLVAVRAEGGGASDSATVSFSDTAGNTFPTPQYVRTGDGSEDEMIGFTYVLNATGNASNVITATWSAARGYRRITCLQFSYSNTALLKGSFVSGLDATNVFAWDSGTDHTVDADDLVIGVLGHYNGSRNPSTPGNFTRVSNVSLNGLLHTYYDPITGSETVSFNGSFSPSDSFVALSVAFEDSSASDTTAPTFGTNPAQGSVASTSVTVTATASDETDSTVSHYAVVVADGASAPSGTQVAAGQDSTGSAAIASGNDTSVSNGVAGSITLTGLTASTSYDVYWIAQDSIPNRTTPQLVNITTTAAADLGLRIPVRNASGANYPDTTGITVVVYDAVGGTESLQTTGAISSGTITINSDSVGSLGAKVFVVGHKDGASDAQDIGFSGEVTVVDLNTSDESV